MGSIVAASKAVLAVDVADAVASDVVTPHPEGHNLNSMQSLPFYDSNFDGFILRYDSFYIVLLFLCVVVVVPSSLFLYLLNLYHTTIFALCNKTANGKRISNELKTGSQLSVGVVFFSVSQEQSHRFIILCLFFTFVTLMNCFKLQ